MLRTLCRSLLPLLVVSFSFTATGCDEEVIEEDMTIQPKPDLASKKDLSMGGADKGMVEEDMAEEEADMAPGEDGGGGACMADGDCMDPAKPRCDKNGVCQACLADMDNCPDGEYCDEANGFVCAKGCKDDKACNGGGGADAGTDDGGVDGGMMGGALACCDHKCIDVAMDNANCGKCGGACNMGDSCCAAACIDSQADIKNCGGCGMACAFANGSGTCGKGMCAFDKCTMGFDDCDKDLKNGCEADVAGDAKNCGACGTACDPVPNGMAACMGGKCAAGTCNMGFGDCDKDAKNGCEEDLAVSAGNCGACGTSCMAVANGMPACMGGMCTAGTCNKGFADCDMDDKTGCETDVTTVKDCGACGTVCAAVANGSAACTAGKCASACNVGFDDCDLDAKNGCEIDTGSDGKNCGACGTVCGAVANGSSTCTKGACVATCSAGYADCDKDPKNGCEINTNTDLNNCGACAAKCGAVANGVSGCAAGKCAVASCNGNFADCDKDAATGCEANTDTDVKNCGACGNACAGTCGTAVSETMAVLPTGWNFNGNASYDAAAKTGVLTPVLTNQAGTILYKRPIKTDSFDVSYDFLIGGGTGGDGIGFIIQKNNAVAVGTGGGGLGISGFTGFGVELDTYDNGVCGDASSNHVAIDNLTPCGGGPPTPLYVNNNLPFQLRNSGWHTCTIKNDAGVFTVTLDGTTVVSLQKVDGYAPGTFYYGFGGATGGSTDRQEIRNVKITFPSPRCL
ncbi:MAG: hypothetical protein EXR72_06310 [Myxococcales bacterium]|nr:hypothetical protein [Myxococcales bacterium]